MNATLISVCSRSFSAHKELRFELDQHFSNVKYNEAGKTLKGDELKSFLKGSVGTVIALEDVNENLLSSLNELKFISKYGVGLNNLDQEAMKRYGVELGWTGGLNKRGVTELTLNMMLTCIRSSDQSATNVRSGNWLAVKGRQLTGKTVGIVGVGHIGKDLVPFLKAFECNVLINDIEDRSEFCKQHGLRQVSKDELYALSDIVTFHVPLNSETKNLVGMKEMKKMKAGAILINTCRGGIVNESDLLNCLQDGTLYSAAMDVFEVEPLTDSPLFGLKNFFPTPHIGGSSDEAILNMGRGAIEHLVRYFK